MIEFRTLMTKAFQFNFEETIIPMVIKKILTDIIYRKKTLHLPETKNNNKQNSTLITKC